MKVFPKAVRRHLLAASAALMSACSSPGYNSNPSQQMTHPTVGCGAGTDFFAVDFRIHVQPLGASPDAGIPRERFRSYCNEIPEPGIVFFTADLPGMELTKIPISIRVVRQDTREDQTTLENRGSSDTALQVPARIYSNGVIESRFELTDRGHYAIDLIRGGEDAVSEEDHLIIPLDVGTGSDAILSFTGTILLLVGVLGTAFLGFAAFRQFRGGGAR